jgi:hypothetical protein
MAGCLKLKIHDIGLGQIRRFSVPSKARVASLALLRAFLRSALGHEPEQLCWIDGDNERIHIINDWDVAEALREAGGEQTLRLEVGSPTQVAAWPLATCTLCAQPISAMRYACADECTALVLCPACGARDDTHPHHRLLKLQRPAHLTSARPPASFPASQSSASPSVAADLREPRRRDPGTEDLGALSKAGSSRAYEPDSKRICVSSTSSPPQKTAELKVCLLRSAC